MIRSALDSRSWNCGYFGQKAFCIERMCARLQQWWLERTGRKRSGWENSRNRAAWEYSQIFKGNNKKSSKYALNMPFMPLTIKYDFICLLNLLNFKFKIKIIVFYSLPKSFSSHRKNMHLCICPALVIT